MTNEERDKMIVETRDAVIGMVPAVGNHDETLYGNTKPGLVKDVTLLQERQNQCPARKATTTESKRLTVATGVIILAFIAFLTNVAFAILTWIK